MKLRGLMVFFTALFLASCTVHEVDLAGLSLVQDQVFHVRSVRTDCYGMAYLPSLPLLNCPHDCQLAILNSIPTADIARILSEAYGINIAHDEAFSISITQVPASTMIEPDDSGNSVVHGHRLEDLYLVIPAEILFALLTPSDHGPEIPCYFLQSTAAGDNPNYITIEYTLHHAENKVTLGYDIAVTASAKILVRHRDDMVTFDDNEVYFSNVVEKIRENAAKIAPALERDIKAPRSASKPYPVISPTPL